MSERYNQVKEITSILKKHDSIRVFNEYEDTKEGDLLRVLEVAPIKPCRCPEYYLNLCRSLASKFSDAESLIPPSLLQAGDEVRVFSIFFPEDNFYRGLNSQEGIDPSYSVRLSLFPSLYTLKEYSYQDPVPMDAFGR